MSSAVAPFDMVTISVAAMAVFNALFLRFSNNVVLKRRVLRTFLAAGGLLLCGDVALGPGRHLNLLLLICTLLAWSWFAWWFFRLTRFCGACGATAYRQPLSQGVRHCRKCGASINEQREVSHT